MKTSFKVKISVNEMYGFLMHHTYHTTQGPFSIIAAIFMMCLFGYMISQGRATAATNLLYPFFALVFLFYLPFSLSKAAVRQAKLNPVFKEPISYEVSEEGIVISQKESSNQITWDQIRKVRETKKSIYVYTGPKNAFIWPKKQLDENALETVKTLIKQYAHK